jgi:type IV secretion system protein TrbJ
MKGDFTMKKINIQKCVIASLFFTIFSFWSYSAHAQWTVIDPSNLAQNILSVLHEAQANIQLATQIQNEIRSLRLLGASAFADIRGILNNNINDLNSLIIDIQGIGFTINSINTEFDAIFPDNASWDAVKLSNYPAFARDWNNKTTSSIKDAMKAQSILSRIIDTNNNVMSILSDVSGSDGQVRQIQASNQILAQMSSQLGDITQSLAVTSRMTATAMAADESRKAASRQIIDSSLSTFSRQDATSPPYSTLPKLNE